MASLSATRHHPTGRRAVDRVRMWRRHGRRQRWAWVQRLLRQIGLASE